MTASPNASLFTYPRFMALNTEGYPLAGGQLYSYQAGTLTPQATYTDATLTVPNPNPIILDAFGTAVVWLGSNAYKFNLLDVNGVQQADFPIDNVTGLNNLSATLAALASTTTAGQGAGLVGYNSSLGYTAGTVGAALAETITPANLVQQTATAFSTGGTGAAYTLASGQAFTTNVANRRLNATFALAGSGAPTFAVDTTPALPLVRYGANGAFIAYQPPAGQNSDVITDATAAYWIVLDPITKGTASGGRFRNLIVTYGQSSGTVTVTADEVTVEDTAGNQTRLQGVSVSAALSTIGAINGTDGSTQTAGNFYGVYVAYNPSTGAVGALVSAGYANGQPTTPISGYTQYCRVGMNKIKQLGPAYWQPGMQNNAEFQVTVGSLQTAMPLIASGALGSPITPTWQVETVRGNGNFVPPTASKIRGVATNFTASAEMAVAPNASYGAVNSTTNPPPFGSIYGGSGFAPPALFFDLVLESAGIYVASTGTAYFFCLGWMDNL